ncbi:hypothetical protein [Nocardioides halotolerans]|uniref:hypothetical protein n=1 Tax=Nocardioides halotolerans TaxID=433660 RepID=UPI0003F9DCF2|nr:hypothetical protein [Nocardioides halotolerans]
MPSQQESAMMRGTPRTFVGSVVLDLAGPVDPATAAQVRAELERHPRIRACELDAASGTLVVTARAAADRNDVVAVLERLGCPVRG